jgi:nucleolar complex protein 3
VAVTAIGRLLVTVPHFNLRTDLLQIIVHQLSRRTEDEAFRKCQEAITTLFQEDEEGRASLEAVTMISKMAKKRHYKIHPFVLNPPTNEC